VADESLNIRAHTSQYFASRLINLEWVKHGAGVHRIFPAGCELKDTAGHVLITAYAVERPDREWSLLLVNRDQSNAHPVVPVFHDQNGPPMHLGGPVRMASFGSEQYTWHSDGPNSRPDPDGPPLRTTVDADANTVFTLPKASVMVLRGKMG